MISYSPGAHTKIFGFSFSHKKLSGKVLTIYTSHGTILPDDTSPIKKKIFNLKNKIF